MDSEVAVDSLHSRVESLRTEFRQGGETRYIEEAIVLARKALELCPPGHPERPRSLSCLAAQLADHYRQLGSMQELNEAISLDRQALDLRPKGHPDRSTSLVNLASRLSTRCYQLWSVQDLNEAIVLGRKALDLRPQGHPERPVSLNNLATDLSTRYKRLGSMQDLDEAIALVREAYNLCHDGHSDSPVSLSMLAVHLTTRYKHLGSMEDLNESIVLGQEALKLYQKGHLGRATCLSILADSLSARYNRLGSIKDLDEAIVLGREALDLCPKGSPHRSALLNNLSVFFSNRYKQLESMQDLGEAIVLGREALDLRPKEHPDRSSSLNNLALLLSIRYRQLRSMQDLDEAIVLGQDALSLRPKGHPDRSASLNNLALHLSARYERLKSMQDLDEAIVLGRDALDLHPKGHPNRSSSLTNVANRLATRYVRLKSIEDLDGAIVLAREARDLRPEGHPERSQSLDYLANHLCNRFVQSREEADKEEAFSLYAQLVHVTQIASSMDLSAARKWIDTAEYLQHSTLLLAYQTSLRLLVQHVATLPSLPQHLSNLKRLTSSLAVDAFSACLRNHSPTTAVELLEQGRGVFWSQLIRLRSPVEDIASSGPAGRTLADEFSRLASLIQTALKSPGTDQHERVWHLNLEMQNVVTKIRELPNHTRFLLPPLFSDLQHAVKGGPVIVINASRYGCDALVMVLDQDPVHIPLQITRKYVRELAGELSILTRRARRNDATKQLALFLRKLWDDIVSPIIDRLQTIHPAGSRIWWCPTAEFSQLPLHAAGPFRKGKQNLPDLYISSYTPTVNALIRARQSDSVAIEQKRFIAIGQGKAVGESELPAVAAELDIIEQRVSSLATFMRVDGEESCIARVVEELGKSEWVHLSCHGLPNRKEPFESSFALRDGHFTIQRIIACDLKNPEFAYLSACHTTVGYKDSPDEVIHLASAMQFAGFRSVIGTMWAVDDGETNKIASTFYKHMVDESGCLDHTRAAYALNKTMRLVNIPFDQKILYIHLGA